MQILAGVLTALALAAPGRGVLDRYEMEKASFGKLYWRGGQLSSRPDRGRAVQSALARVEERLGRRLEAPVTVVFAPDRGEFARVVTAMTRAEPSRWTLGIALVGRRTIVLREDDLPGGGRPWQRPDTTLAHELAHLLNHRRPDRPVPRWFDEGVAMWASQDGISPEDEARLSGLARIGGLFALRDLERAFPRLHHPGSIAYQQSLMVVTFMVERHGVELLVGLLDGLESGEPFEEIYRELTESSWLDLEPQFRAWIVRRHSLLSAAAALVSFWTIIALFAVVAIGVEAVRRRGARRRLAGSEDDGGEDGPEEDGAPGT